MMIAPRTFVDEYRNCSYAELIDVRNDLIKDILEFEHDEKIGFRDEGRWGRCPNPQVVYRMNMAYLQELLKLMQDKYDEETIMVNDKNEDEQVVFIRNVIWSEAKSDESPGSFTKAAKKFLNNLIKNGNGEAMNLKGAMYYEGVGVEQNLKKAVTWYKKAADAGCSLAMSNLGYCYYYGKGTAVNMALAYKYFSMAVQHGEWDAINKLGDMYREGFYVPKDEKMAFNLYEQCYRTVPHDATNDAYPACLIRMAECTDNPTIAYKMLKEAEKILSIQVSAGNYYAELNMDRVKRLLDRFED